MAKEVANGIVNSGDNWFVLRGCPPCHEYWQAVINRRSIHPNRQMVRESSKYQPPPAPPADIATNDAMQTTLGKLVYTKAEAARMLGVKENSIDWLLRKGILPHRKVAGKIRFAEIDLLTYLERVKVDGAVTPCCAADRKGG
jgi:hypothetical protein